MWNISRNAIIMMTTFFLLLVGTLMAIGLGSVFIPIKDIWATLFSEGTSSLYEIIIWEIRFPRILLALIIGANLAVSGALLQAVLNNPLADPGLTGVTSGAALCVLLIMLVSPEYSQWIPLAAFGGGLITAGVVYLLAWRKSGLSPLMIILSGIAVNALCGGGIGWLSLMFSDRLPTAVQWLNGSLAAKGNNALHMLFPYALVGWILSFLAIRKANILRLGEQMAANLGENVDRTRLLLSVLAVFLAAISVATIGMIGFLGLIIPHMARLLLGSDYKFIFPMSMGLGAFVLLLADTFGRTMFAPLDLPAGMIMALFGAPYFLYLMRRRSF